MPLPEGTWNINANSFTGNLIVTSVSANGVLEGTVFGNQIEGFWDDRSQKITFLRVPPSGTPNAIQVYTGFLFQNPRNPGGGDNVTFTLTGFFEAFAGTGGNAERTLYGWFAQLEVVG